MSAMEKKLEELMKDEESKLSPALKTQIRDSIVSLIYQTDKISFESQYAMFLEDMKLKCTPYFDYENRTWKPLQTQWALCYRQADRNPQKGDFFLFFFFFFFSKFNLTFSPSFLT
jgi:hypothetical protein